MEEVAGAEWVNGEDERTQGSKQEREYGELLKLEKGVWVLFWMWCKPIRGYGAEERHKLFILKRSFWLLLLGE